MREAMPPLLSTWMEKGRKVRERSLKGAVLEIILKERVLSEPFEFNCSRRAASLLGDDDFGETFVGRIIRVIIIVAVDEHDRVSVLFDSAGFTKI